MSDFVEDIVKRIAPDLTETQIAATAELARAKAMAAGGGLAQLYTDSQSAAEVVVKEAVRETMAKLKAKGETDLAAPEVAKLEKQRLCFGKAGADAPLKHRGDYVREYGIADFEAAIKLWGASATDLTPRKNPFTKPVKKAMRAARNGTLEATPFNLAMNPDQVKQPKPQKIKLAPDEIGPNLNLTKLGQLFKTDPGRARLVAQLAGVKLP